VTLDELRREALELAPLARVELARALLQSLVDLSEPEIERLWLDEAERRWAAYKRERGDHSLEELAARMPKNYQPGELNCGSPVGREV
jgi:hypothetical protein